MQHGSRAIERCGDGARNEGGRREGREARRGSIVFCEERQGRVSGDGWPLAPQAAAAAVGGLCSERSKTHRVGARCWLEERPAAGTTHSVSLVSHSLTSPAGHARRWSRLEAYIYLLVTRKLATAITNFSLLPLLRPRATFRDLPDCQDCQMQRASTSTRRRASIGSPLYSLQPVIRYRPSFRIKAGISNMTALEWG